MVGGDVVLFAERTNESPPFLYLRSFALKVKGNRVLIGRFSDFPREEKTGDPKPGELTMARVNLE